MHFLFFNYCTLFASGTWNPALTSLTLGRAIFEPGMLHLSFLTSFYSTGGSTYVNDGLNVFDNLLYIRQHQTPVHTSQIDKFLYLLYEYMLVPPILYCAFKVCSFLEYFTCLLDSLML